MGHQRNRLDGPIIFFSFSALQVTPGPLQRILEPPKTVISGVEPKTRLWGINVIVSMRPSKFLIFLYFWLYQSPQDPSEGSWNPPPKKVIAGVKQKKGCWGINGIVLMRPSKFLNFFAFLALPVTPGPLRRVLEPPQKRLFLESNQKPGYGAST